MAVVGWFLLGILGLLLLILLLVLFLPVSYRLEAEKTAEHLSLKARASWLFGLIRLLYLYPEPGKPQIRIAWFSLDHRRRPEKTKTAAGKTSGKAADSGQAAEEGAETEQEIAEESSGKPSAEIEKKADPVCPPDGSPESVSENTEQAAEAAKPGDAEGKKAGSGTSLPEMYRKVRKEADFFWKLWQQETTKSFVSEFFARILRIFRNVFPREIKGKILFGAASPDITGYVLAIYSIARVKFPRRLFIDFTPDFENQVLEGEVLIRGHVMLATFVWNGLRILLDKRLRKLWRQIKRHYS